MIFAFFLFFILLALLILGSFFFLLYRIYFLRHPKRKIPGGNTVISPANGKVVRIVEFDGGKNTIDVRKGVLGRLKVLTKDVVDKGYLIVIMMTPLNVHFQKSPVEGVVESIRYRRGKFMNAVRDAASLNCLENEHNEIIINNGIIGKVKVVQVAGFLARRIHCFVKFKQKVHKGDDIGLISLGSQVLLVIPRIELGVKVGEDVVDGETVIARF
jgi:phosphatidylserine decarboxylase